jgi:hypothetical protein
MITCKFYHNSNNTKSCRATYFDEHCQSELFTANASSTANSVDLTVTMYPFIEPERFCYVIAASNGTMEANISGFIVYQTGINFKLY